MFICMSEQVTISMDITMLGCVCVCVNLSLIIRLIFWGGHVAQVSGS